jgi:hypothetical protein
MTQPTQCYSVYISPYAVELRNIDDSDGCYAHLVCSQTSYHNILNFALELAYNKKLPFKNLIADHLKPSLEVEDGYDR